MMLKSCCQISNKVPRFLCEFLQLPSFRKVINFPLIFKSEMCFNLNYSHSLWFCILTHIHSSSSFSNMLLFVNNKLALEWDVGECLECLTKLFDAQPHKKRKIEWASEKKMNWG